MFVLQIVVMQHDEPHIQLLIMIQIELQTVVTIVLVLQTVIKQTLMVIEKEMCVIQLNVEMK